MSSEYDKEERIASSKADNLSAICELISFLENGGSSTSHNPMGLHNKLHL
jgi:hypothetical protein